MPWHIIPRMLTSHRRPIQGLDWRRRGYSFFLILQLSVSNSTENLHVVDQRWNPVYSKPVLSTRDSIQAIATQPTACRKEQCPENANDTGREKGETVQQMKLGKRCGQMGKKQRRKTKIRLLLTLHIKHKLYRQRIQVSKLKLQNSQ